VCREMRGTAVLRGEASYLRAGSGHLCGNAGTPHLWECGSEGEPVDRSLFARRVARLPLAVN
jgi:hypothetical protein